MQLLSNRIIGRAAGQYALHLQQKAAVSHLVGLNFNPTSAVIAKNRNKRNYAVCKQKLLSYPALPLEETINKFKTSIKPFFSDSDYEQCIKEINVFLHCDAPKLQKLLEKEAAKSENWLSDRWLKAAYLRYRDPVVIYSSPGMTFPRTVFGSDCEWLSYTAKVIFCLIKFKEVVDDGKLPIQKIGDNELDNSQFGKVMGTCRIPFHKEDKMLYCPNSKYVVVIYKNHFYKLNVYDRDDDPLHADIIKDELNCIVQKEKEDGPPFGILTTENRDNWAKAYKELMKLEGNKPLIETIQKSLFTVSLDEKLTGECGKDPKVALAELLIHGGGPTQYAANRWYDKTIQLIISRSGYQGFCYEHSPAEGQPIAVMVDYVIKNFDNKKLANCASTENYEPSKKLDLKCNNVINDYFMKAEKNLEKITCDLEVYISQFSEYGKDFIKKQKLGPDSYCQMAMQYAFFKLHKSPAATYESAHLRVFRDGRTETIRSCSPESMAFTKGMCEPNSDEKRAELLRKAVKAHGTYTKWALLGRGVDRHLLGLKMMALENNLPVPEFFLSEAFKKSTHFRLSTSQVASPNEAFMAYGPSCKDGYACCYNPRAEDMYFAITAWKSCEETCAEHFATALCDALQEMMIVLCKANESKAKAKL